MSPVVEQDVFTQIGGWTSGGSLTSGPSGFLLLSSELKQGDSEKVIGVGGH